MLYLLNKNLTEMWGFVFCKILCIFAKSLKLKFMAQKFVLVINKDDYRNSMVTKNLVVELRFGNVAFHKDLLESDEICLGGGDYEVIKDNDKENIVLSGQSFDYGVPRWYMIKGVTSDYYVTGALIYKYPNEYQYKDCEDVDVKKLFWLK